MIRFGVIGAAAAALLAMPGIAGATNLTWVSGVGDDANPCSRTAPCKTFAGALSKTTTAGTINVLDAGDFGAVNITKAVTIDGGGGLGAVTSSTQAITVNPGEGALVTLRNLQISGSVFGSAGVVVQSGDAILDGVFIHHFMNCASALATSGLVHLTLRNSTIAACTVGVVASSSGGTGAQVTVDSVGIHDTTTGVLSMAALGASTQLRISRSTITDCVEAFFANRAGMILEPFPNLIERFTRRTRLLVGTVPMGTTQFVGPKRKPIGLKFSPSVATSATAVIKKGTKTIATLKKNLKAVDSSIVWNAKAGKVFAGAGTYDLKVTFKSQDGQTDSFTGTVKLT